MNSKLQTLALTILIFCLLPTFSFSAVAINTHTNTTTSQQNHDRNISRETLEKNLGRKLSFKERLLLPFMVKKLKKETANNYEAKNQKRNGGKSQIVALILCLFLGLLGIHRFYLGYTGTGILFLLTAGIFGIGWLIDLILLIIPNGLSPKGRTSYRE